MRPMRPRWPCYRCGDFLLLGFYCSPTREEVGGWNVSLVSKSKIDHHCQLCRRWSQHSCHIPEGVSECPQHEWLSETALPSFSLSLSDHRSISLSTCLLLEVGKPWRDLVQHLHLHLHVERGSTLGQPR